MKSNLLLLLSLLLCSTSLMAQLDLTTGGSGTTTGVPQSYNESREIDVTVLSSFDLQLTSMMLNRFYVGGDGMAIVGARIYDSGTSALLYSRDTTVYNIFNGFIWMQASYVLHSGQSYRIGFYCSGTNSDNSAYMHQPTSFPYTESNNILRINHAYSISQDTFAVNVNIFVPFVTLFYDSLSTTNLMNEGHSDAPFNLFPNPAGDFLNISAGAVYSSINIEVIDALGKVLIKQKDADVQHFNINSSGLASGVYFVKITVDEKTAVLKLVKN